MGVFKQQGKGAGNYFQIKFGRMEKAVTFALRNRRKADVLRKVGKGLKKTVGE